MRTIQNAPPLCNITVDTAIPGNTGSSRECRRFCSLSVPISTRTERYSFGLVAASILYVRVTSTPGGMTKANVCAGYSRIAISYPPHTRTHTPRTSIKLEYNSVLMGFAISGLFGRRFDGVKPVHLDGAQITICTNRINYTILRGNCRPLAKLFENSSGMSFCPDFSTEKFVSSVRPNLGACLVR